MAPIAIADGSSVSIPGFVPAVSAPRRRPSGRNRKLFLSKVVRTRNARSDRPWWQPSRPLWRPRIPRSAELAAAIQEEFDDTALAPDEFWCDDSPVSLEQWQLLEQHEDVGTYEQYRASEDAVEIELRQRQILDGIEDELCSKVPELHAEAAKLEMLERMLSSELDIVSQDERNTLAARLAAVRFEIKVIQLELNHLDSYATAA